VDPTRVQLFRASASGGATAAATFGGEQQMLAIGRALLNNPTS